MSARYYSAGAVSALVGAVLLFGSTPFWWIGAGLISGGVAVVVWRARDGLRETFEQLREPRQVWGVEFTPASMLAELLCLAILAGLTVAMLPNATLGDRPVNHDHTVHFFKAWQLEQHFLAEGHLFGWSHRWFAGYPAQYLYPIGADVLVVSIHALTFGLVDLGHAYAWAVWIFWFLGGYAVYRFGAETFGRWGGVIAGILFMTDTAANRVGGWYFAMKWGVWPMSLSVVLAVWAMARVPRLMTETRWRDVAAFGCLLAAALVTHPFMMIHFALALTVAVLAFWLANRDVHWVVGSGRLVLGWATGTLLAMVWVLPFLVSSDFMDPHFGGRWKNMYKLGNGIYGLDLFAGTWAFATALGVVGMLALIWSRQFGRLLVGLLGLAFLIVGSSDFLAAFNFLEVFSNFQRVHFKRFVTLLKPYWMIAAAYGVVCVVRYTAGHAVEIWRRTGEVVDGGGDYPLQGAAKIWVQFFIAGFCLVPLLVPFGETFGGKHVNRNLRNASERAHQRERDQIVQWFQDEYPDGEPFFRVGMDLFQHNHRFVDLGTRLPFPVYKVGYTPATSYKFRPEEGSPEIFEAFNVRYVITKGAPPRGDFREVETFGQLALYEFEDWQREPFDIVEGEGEVELKSFGTGEIVLEAEEGSKGRLRLNVSKFSRWHAYRDGRELSISETQVAGNESTGMMTVELRPGTYRFVFERGWAELFAWLLFLLGLLLAIGFAAADLEIGSASVLRERLDAMRDWVSKTCREYEAVLDVAGVFVLAAGFGFLIWMAWHWPKLRVEGTSLAEDTAEVHYDFGDQLRHARVEVGKGDDPDVCDAMMGYFVCGNASWKMVHQRMEDFGPELSMARCIWAHPLPKGPIELHFRDVPTGDAVVGYYGVPESGHTSERSPVVFEVGVGGVYEYSGEASVDKKLFSFRVPIDRADAGASVDVAFRVDAENTGKRHFCFNAQVVDLVDGAPVEASEGNSGS